MTNGTELVETSCPVCRTDHPRPTYRVEDWEHGHGEQFTFVSCGNCSALYLNPRPGPAKQFTYYPIDYEAFQRDPVEDAPFLYRLARLYGLDKRCKAVTKLIPCGRLLDVGCATGDFLARMRLHGSWELVGLEPDELTAELARRRHSLEIHNYSLDEANLASGYFDVVTLWDVIEHLPNPRESLQRIADWLRPEGYLVIRTPNAGSPYARAFGRYWAGLDSPRHLIVLDRSSLTELLQSNGFQIERMWTLSGSFAMTVLSCRFWLKAHGFSPLWSKPLGSPVMQVLSSPLFWLTDRFGGASITAVARLADST